MRVLLAVALVSWAGLLMVVDSVFTLSFRTNDDAEMMAAVSGYDGGVRRPEMLFSSVLIGHVLRALYEWAPSVPWYGYYLHGSQIVALALTSVALIVVARRMGRLRMALGVGVLVVFAIGFMVSVQFTIVAFLLVLGGTSTSIMLLAVGRSPWLSGALGGLLAGFGALVRFQSFGAGMLLAVMSMCALFFLVSRAMRTRLLTAGATFVAGSLLIVMVSNSYERSWWVEQTGRERPAVAESGQVGPSTSASRLTVEAVGSGTPSSADVSALMRQNWIIDDSLYRRVPLQGDRPNPPADAAPLRKSFAGLIAEVFNQLPSGVRTAATYSPWFLVASGLLLFLNSGGRRSLLVTGAFLSASFLLMGFVASTRFPDRVALPMQAMTLILALLMGSASNPASGMRSRIAGGLAVVLVGTGLITSISTAHIMSDEADARRHRAERFLEDIHAIDPRGTYAVWLIDAWNALEPLGFGQQHKYRNAVVQIAGWTYLLPHHSLQQQRLSETGWIDAVVADDSVYLVASEDRVELLRRYLRDFRGLLCTAPRVVATTRGGRDVVVQRFDEVPCQGQVVS